MRPARVPCGSPIIQILLSGADLGRKVIVAVGGNSSRNREMPHNLGPQASDRATITLAEQWLLFRAAVRRPQGT